jgi:hypothetical protein
MDEETARIMEDHDIDEDTAEKISLMNNPLINEAVIQEQIAKNPSILGLGELILKDKERIQPMAGRLDILLQDPETKRRYEVEIQLGKTNESHIIRTLEYWDIERKRYPQYDHCAVIVAEEITARFLNVISLFNGNIPLIAIQMNAYKTGNKDEVMLTFTTVLDELTLGMVDEDEEVQEVTDRNYWINRADEETVKMADHLLETINEISDGEIHELKYNKFYIGLSKGGRANNFALFVPRKSAINMIVKLPYTDEMQKKIDEAGLEDMGYDRKWRQYRLRLTKKDLIERKELLRELFSGAYQNSR